MCRSTPLGSFHTLIYLFKVSMTMCFFVSCKRHWFTLVKASADEGAPPVCTGDMLAHTRPWLA